MILDEREASVTCDSSTFGSDIDFAIDINVEIVDADADVDADVDVSNFAVNVQAVLLEPDPNNDRAYSRSGTPSSNSDSQNLMDDENHTRGKT